MPAGVQVLDRSAGLDTVGQLEHSPSALVKIFRCTSDPRHHLEEGNHGAKRNINLVMGGTRIFITYLAVDVRSAWGMINYTWIQSTRHVVCVEDRLLI